MIIGTLAAIFILAWFYNTAPKYGRKPLHWAIAGVMVYFIVAMSWTVLVNPSIKDAAMHGRNMMLMYLSKYAYIVIALACAVFFNFKIGPKK